VDHGDRATEGITVLVVCTANLVRSPIAEALLRARLDVGGVAATVRSCGLRAQPGAGFPAAAAAAVGRRLGAVPPHRARALDGDEAVAADLVVTMTRAQLRELVVATSVPLARAFTLKELVRRAGATAPRSASEAWTAWLDRVGAGRERRDLLGDSRADDVADPFGGTAADYERCVDGPAMLAAALVAAAWPAAAHAPARRVS
jgi:protein-tyrosine phosphatase